MHHYNIRAYDKHAKTQSICRAKAAVIIHLQKGVVCKNELIPELMFFTANPKSSFSENKVFAKTERFGTLRYSDVLSGATRSDLPHYLGGSSSSDFQ